MIQLERGLFCQILSRRPANNSTIYTFQRLIINIIINTIITNNSLLLLRYRSVVVDYSTVVGLVYASTVHPAASCLLH